MYWNKVIDPDSVYGAAKRDRKLVSLGYKREDEFIVKLAEELKAAAKKAGYDLIAEYSNNSVAIQLEQVENARRREIKGMIVNLVTPESAPEVLKAAGNMKVVFMAYVPADMSILNNNAIYVGADQSQAGRLQGEWLANYFKERGKTEIRYILLKGVEYLPITKERTEHALKALEDAGIKAIPVVPPIVADYERNEATSKLLPILRSGVKFDAIIANDDAMALGAIDALEALGMNPSKTVIVGIDAIEPGIRALLEGKLAMTVYQNRKERAAATIKALDNMLNGRPFSEGMANLVSKENPYAIIFPYEIVTRYKVPKDLYL
ncbi:MAG: sugar ABC transporter substrate-binding protein [Candidatus Fimivivens sp.]|nr:sugar ABC transporter substrate-binding protein [Candidatus Fimivivens sp.]